MTLSAVVDGVINLAVSNQSVLIPGLVFVLLLVSLRSLLPGRQNRGLNPFLEDHRRPPEPFVHDSRVRDAVLKDRFKSAKVPDNLDAIIIGSGAGGLSAGVLLTFSGQKVLVLEQHDQAGGCCHSFVEKGFEFDTGIHYVGDVHEGAITRVLLDQLTSGQLRWVRLDDVFDTVAVGKPTKPKWFPMNGADGQYFQNLIKMFPGEKETILAYKKLIKDAKSAMTEYAVLKMIPAWIARLLVNTGLHRWLLKCYRRGYATKSLQSFLDGLTNNKELKLVLSYLCGDYGVLPKDVPFMLHAGLIEHYARGAYYPANGTSEIAFHMIQTIERAGGKVLVQAPVTKILCDPAGRAVGVHVGKNQVEIRAKYIISDAGVANTFRKLLPVEVARKSPIYPLIDKVGPSNSFISAFIGIDGSSHDLKLPAGNVWLYETDDINKAMTSYLDTPRDMVQDIHIPFSFFSFPSAKDPEYEKKFPGKSAALVITLAKWDWFKEWQEDKVRHRGDRYEGIKDVLGRQMWQQCVDLFPQLDGKKVYMEVGTPVTNQHYLACPEGETYGLNQDLKRFSPEAASKLRAETGIKGLYLTGQDAMAAGFTPSILSGVFCASKILKRNIYWDLLQLHKSVGHTNGLPLKKKL